MCPCSMLNLCASTYALQMWCGRLAMMGFLTSLIQEFMTGQGTLGQLGVYTPSTGLCVALCTLTGVATTAGIASTVIRLTGKKMTKK